MEALNNAWQVASQEMYQTQEAQEGATEDAGGKEAKGDDVSDVEFEEVEEDKK